MTETIYRLPTWGETVLVIVVAIMLATLAAFLFANSVCRMLDAEAKVQAKRRDSESKALDKWKALYEDEKKHRLEAVSDLMDENLELRKHAKNLEDLLDKVPVSVLKQIQEEVGAHVQV